MSTMPIYTVERENYLVSTDLSLLDLDVIHSYLSRSYWARGVPREVVEKAVKHSLCFGLYEENQQIGFAALVTDYTHFAYLKDVFVLEEHQGRGLGTWLIDCVLACPHLKGLRAFLLTTDDAHRFYEKFGFEVLPAPEKFMQKTFHREWFQEA